MSPQCSQAKVAKSHGVPVGYPAFPFVLAGANYRNACLLAKFVRLASCFFCLSKYCISHLSKVFREQSTNQPSLCRAILFTTGVDGIERAPIHIGIGRCLGRGVRPAPEIVWKAPWKSMSSSVQSFFKRTICSSHRLPRLLKSILRYWYSSSLPPTPIPNRTRPPDRSSSSAACLAK